MPIPLGILAATGFRPTAGGSYELIETITVGAGGVASVTFSNLNTYSTTYQHLQIRAVSKSTANEPLRDLLMQFNGVTTADYSLHLLYGLGGSVTSGASANTSSIAMGGIPGSQSSSGTFGAQVIDILMHTKPRNSKPLGLWVALSKIQEALDSSYHLAQGTGEALTQSVLSHSSL